MATVGDLVAVLSMDVSRFQSGAAAAQSSAKQTGAVIGAALNPRTMQQAGFALQDFFSVLNQGGANSFARAMGGIMNNVQMLGAGFGPVGMAVTSLGAGLATVLIPALLQAEDTMKGLNQTFERNQQVMDNQISTMQRVAQEQAKLDQLRREGTAKQAKEEETRATGELDQVMKEIKIRGDRLRTEINQANVAARNAGEGDAVTRISGPSRVFDDEGRIAENARLQVSDKLYDSFQKQRDALIDLQRRERELIATRKELQEMRPDLLERDDRNGPGALAEEKTARERHDATRKILDSMKTERERSNDRIAEIKELGREGYLLSSEVETAIRNEVMARPIQPGMQQALLAGSSDAISQINKAQVGADLRGEQIKLAQQLVDEAKQQLQVLQNIQNNVSMQPVAIGQ